VTDPFGLLLFEKRIMARFAGIEAGGTTWVVAIAEGDPSNIVERADFPTSTPEEVLAQVVDWLKTRKVTNTIR
jgi:predicted NBD/HSP70 family sugar kinase